MDDVTVTTTPTDYQLAAVAELAKATAPASAEAAPPSAEDASDEAQAQPEAAEGADEAQAAEEQAEGEKPAASKEERLSRAYTALAKQRQKLAARREQFAQETARFAAEREALAREVTEARAVREAMAAAKADPLKALELLGVDYDTLTQAVLTAGKPESADARAAREEVRQLREEMRRANEERQQQEMAQAARSAEQSTRAELAAVAKDTTTYPLASCLDPDEAADAAWQVMQDVYRRSQKILAVADAMSYVEEALSVRLSRWGVAPTPPQGGSGRVNGAGAKPAKPEAAAAVARSTPRTLTNNMAAQPASPPSEMTEAELRKAAAQMLRFV